VACCYANSSDGFRLVLLAQEGGKMTQRPEWVNRALAKAQERYAADQRVRLRRKICALAVRHLPDDQTKMYLDAFVHPVLVKLSIAELRIHLTKLLRMGV
jgi:hypothetical protein